MPKIIILSVIMLIGSLTNAGIIPDITYEQRVCASVDKSAYAYKSTTLRYIIKYYDYDGKSYSKVLLDQRPKIKINYGQAPICQTLKIPQKKKLWYFNERIIVALENYGDCTISFNPNKTINVTLYHRPGNPLYSWSCAAD